MSEQLRIATELGVHPSIDPGKEVVRRVEFLHRYLAHTGVKGFVLGVSGGQDSLLAGLLAQRAVEAYRAHSHKAEFHALLLPYRQQVDAADAALAIETIQPDVVHRLDIQPATDAMVDEYNTNGGEPLSDFHKGNIKARMRMVAHYAIAGQHNLLVIGTDHAAEAVTGFFTKFGDGAADVVPLHGLTKRQGRLMLEHLHAPDIFLTKKPTADLLDTNPGQADEAELGLSYDQIDDYLEGKPVEDVVAARIEAYYDRSWHKRNLPVSFA